MLQALIDPTAKFFEVSTITIVLKDSADNSDDL